MNKREVLFSWGEYRIRWLEIKPGEYDFTIFDENKKEVLRKVLKCFNSNLVFLKYKSWYELGLYLNTEIKRIANAVDMFEL